MRTIFLLLISIFALCSCAPKVTVAPEFEANVPQSIAVLPAEYPETVARERVDYLRRGTELELQNRGFVVLDDAIVNKVCSNPSCPERTVLASKYLVDGFASVKIGSVARNNFLAGYYNAIAGDLVFEDVAGKELLRVTHTESERGGLLFNSGQIIQGLISTVENAENKNPDALSNSFARTLTSKVPPPSKTAPPSDQVAISISNVAVTPVRLGARQVCVDATPGSSAFVIFSRHRSNLREVKPGRYCGIYWFDRTLAASTGLSVEIRSPFGNSDRRELPPESVYACDPKDLFKLVRNGAGYQVAVDRSGNACAAHKFIVYKGLSPVGPFLKVGEISGPAWTDKSVKSSETPIYQIIAVDKAGLFSLPVAVITTPAHT